MANSITCISALPAHAHAATELHASIRRRITAQAGHALEILGHAIEYLTDEYVHEGGSSSAGDPRLEAIQMLMSLNRQVYFACPEVPTLRQRIGGWLRRRPAAGKTGGSTRLSS